MRVLGLLAVAAACAGPRTPRDPHVDWLRDYDQLRAYTTSSFANFEYRVRTLALDLPRLDRDTRDAIRRAPSQTAAQQAVRAFVAAFHDAHFRLTPLGASAVAPPPIPGNATPEAACQAMGVHPVGPAPIAWDRVPGFVALPTAIAGLDHGFLDTPAGKVAVLRIPVLGGRYYPEVCARAWREREVHTPCDASCQDELTLAMDQLVLDELGARLDAFTAAHPRALLVDVTHDGGGSDLAVAFARMLTSRELASPEIAVIRQPHWEHMFEAAEADFRNELASRSDLSRQQRALLETAAARASAARRDAAARCDLSAVWTTSPAQFACSATVRFAGYVDPHDTSDVSALETRGYLHADAEYRFTRGRWTGPLWLLVDHGSASATEELAAVLQDYGGATVLGATTMGIGCGYTNGGTHVALPALGLVAKAPDCIRFRSDATSESAGVRPQIAIDMTIDDHLAERVRAALPPDH